MADLHQSSQKTRREDGATDQVECGANNVTADPVPNNHHRVQFVALGIVVACTSGRSCAAGRVQRPCGHCSFCIVFVGLSFLVPGVVSPDVPAAWVGPAAYGDLIAAILALMALAGRKVGNSPGLGVQHVGLRGPPLRFYEANRGGLDPGQLGAGYFIVTVFVPLLLITHGLLFRLLLSKDVAAAEPDSRRAAQRSPA
jgi:hypothetical protein